MKPEVRIELTRQLEVMKGSREGANSRWLFYLGVIAELIGAVAFIAWSVRLTIQADAEKGFYWAVFVVLFLGIILLAHAAYLTIKRSMNRRLRPLYEAVLDTTSQDSH